MAINDNRMKKCWQKLPYSLMIFVKISYYILHLLLSLFSYFLNTSNNIFCHRAKTQKSLENEIFWNLSITHDYTYDWQSSLINTLKWVRCDFFRPHLARFRVTWHFPLFPAGQVEWLDFTGYPAQWPRCKRTKTKKIEDEEKGQRFR